MTTRLLVTTIVSRWVDGGREPVSSSTNVIDCIDEAEAKILKEQLENAWRAYPNDPINHYCLIL